MTLPRNRDVREYEKFRDVNSDVAVGVAILDGSGNQITDFLTGLVTENYDYISLSYTGDNLTGVVYKTGGSGGTTVATVTLAYDGSDNLITATKT